jgi:hypothetical protein
MKTIRARLQHDVKHGASGPSVFRSKRVRDGLKLAGGVGRRINDRVLSEAGNVEVAVEVPGISAALTTVNFLA